MKVTVVSAAPPPKAEGPKKEFKPQICTFITQAEAKAAGLPVSGKQKQGECYGKTLFMTLSPNEAVYLQSEADPAAVGIIFAYSDHLHATYHGVVELQCADC